jgi:hypothetical protein
MSQTIADALQGATFYTDGETYRLVKLPTAAITAAAGIIAEVGQPFCGLIADKDEVTLIIPDDAVNDFASRMPGHVVGKRYALLTIDNELEPDLIGFMAVISKALADNNVGVFPYAAYTRDHILVPQDQLDTAIAALEQLRQSTRIDE